MIKKIVGILAVALVGFAEKFQAAKADFGSFDAITLRASGDLTGMQYRVVRGDGAGLTNVCSQTAVTSLGPQIAMGVLQTNPKSGGAASVAYNGLSKVVVGAAVTANGLATHNSSGQAIDAVSGAVVIGRFLDAPANAGELASILLFPPTRWGQIL